MTVITGAEDIEHARWLAVRSALSLEIKGLKRRGKSARQLANDITGNKGRSARSAYQALNNLIVAELGKNFDRPLPEPKP